jgi:hypothetical protein
MAADLGLTGQQLRNIWYLFTRIYEQQYGSGGGSETTQRRRRRQRRQQIAAAGGEDLYDDADADVISKAMLLEACVGDEKVTVFMRAQRGFQRLYSKDLTSQTLLTFPEFLLWFVSRSAPSRKERMPASYYGISKLELKQATAVFDSAVADNAAGDRCGSDVLRDAYGTYSKILAHVRQRSDLLSLEPRQRTKHNGSCGGGGSGGGGVSAKSHATTTAAYVRRLMYMQQSLALDIVVGSATALAFVTSFVLSFVLLLW